LRERARKIQFIHFGTPCKSWSHARRLNHGILQLADEKGQAEDEDSEDSDKNKDKDKPEDGKTNKKPFSETKKNQD
jgi:hypothetical protein